MYVNHRFNLDPYTIDLINDTDPNFDLFGEITFYRTYSRITKEGKQETWADVVQRVIEGTFSIRKDWYLKNFIPWDEKYWQIYAREMSLAMLKMEWLPPGRGLWAMGTNFIYERGGMALYNCSYSDVNFKTLDKDLSWIMDCLMLGVGVGFSPIREDWHQFKNPKGEYEYIIPDSREGWIGGLENLIRAYMYGASKPKFIFDKVRDKGLPIKGFGGISSGPEPLKYLYEWIEQAIDQYMIDAYYDSVILKADIINQIGCCVVAGNVRRSAELACAPINDNTFIHLKNYNYNPKREAWGWMSNNSVILQKTEDFDQLPRIAEYIKINGEPGYLNLINFPKGRIGKKNKLKKDKAVGTNPCAEIPLENKEVCNIAETLPTVCESTETWHEACKYATLYCSTVSLLPTHQPETNKVVARNRRIGVSIIDFTGWISDIGTSSVIKNLRYGYKIIRKTNKEINSEAGIPESIRVTTVKPGGTVPKLAAKTSGCMYPNFHFMIRRIRVPRNQPIHQLLIEANIPYENDYVSKNTDVFEIPYHNTSEAPEAGEVSIWQQAMNLILLQREWADNAVSNTLNFRPKWVLIKIIEDGTEVYNIEDQLRAWIMTHYHNPDKMILELYKNDTYETIDHKIIIKWDKDFNNITEVKIYQYDPKHEEDSIEAVLAAIAPLTKTVSMLPHTPKGVYIQTPEEGISEEEYQQRLRTIKKINWEKLSGSDGEDNRYCEGDTCDPFMKELIR